MAYISLIQQDWHAEAFRVGKAYQIVINVGADLTTSRTYSIALGLEPLTNGAVEFYFYIISLNEMNDEFKPYYSGLDSQNIIPKVQRGPILRAILHAAKLLLNQVNPTSVNWCSWGRDLPEKALFKYSQLVRVFETCGYRVEAAEPYHGQLFWSAERLNPPSFPFDGAE